MRTLLLSAILLAPACVAQLSVAGVVRDAKGPLEGANVTLRGRTGGDRIQATNAKGEFVFDGLDNAVYTIIYEKRGYKTVTRRVTVTFEKDEDDNFDVTLEPETAPKASLLLFALFDVGQNRCQEAVHKRLAFL
jgi:hypothetical protein